MNQRFHVQNKFTKTNHISIKKIYGIPEKEILWICFFAGNQFSLPLRKCGFVFTDKALYYQYPVKMFEADGNEVSHKKCGFLSLRNTKIEECSVITDENKYSVVLKVKEILCVDGKTETAEVHLRTYTFELCSNVSNISPELWQKNASFLENAFKLYFSGTLQTESFDEDDESYSALFTIFATKDLAAETFLQLKGKFSRFIGTVKTKVSGKKSELKKGVRVSKEQKVEKEKAKAEAEEPERVQTVQKEENKPSKVKGGFVKIGHFFRHLFDLCADLSFMLFVLLCVKPQILSQEYVFTAFKDISENLKISLLIKADFADVDPEVLYLAGLYAIIIGAFALFTKIIIILSCKTSRKIVSFLLLVILGATTFLIPDKFLMFVILTPLILLAIQYSMGFDSKVIKLKSLLLLIFTISGYIAIHLIQNPNLCNLVVDVFRLNANWW